MAISPFQVVPLLAVIKSYKEKKEEKVSFTKCFSNYYLHIWVLLVVIQWKYSAYKSEKTQLYNKFQVVYIVKHYVLILFYFAIQDNETYNLD